jgi:hypothetical protein
MSMRIRPRCAHRDTPTRPHTLHTFVHRLWAVALIEEPPRASAGIGTGSVLAQRRPARAEAPRVRGDPVAESYNGYCVKCKEKRDFDGEVKVSESGRRMAQGTCPVCGTKMNRILGKA